AKGRGRVGPDERAHADRRLPAEHRGREHVRGIHEQKIDAAFDPSHNVAAAHEIGVLPGADRIVIIERRERPSGYGWHRGEAAVGSWEPETYAALVGNSTLRQQCECAEN